MFRKEKTHIPYNKNGIIIRPAYVGEEYEVGDWPDCYSILKMGYQNPAMSEKYSDIIYVMTINKNVVGYFMANRKINVGDNKDLPLCSKELQLYDFAVATRSYAKHSKILFDYIIKYSSYNGYHSVSYAKDEKYCYFNRFVKKHYNTIQIGNKVYIPNTKVRIPRDKVNLCLYPKDVISLEDLYFLYDLNFKVNKKNCSIKLNDSESIKVDRTTGIITFPTNVTITKEQVILNKKTQTLIYTILKMYQVGNIEKMLVDYSANNPNDYEAVVGDLVYTSKTIKEILNDKSYTETLKQKGFIKVAPDYLRYNMDEGGFSESLGIYEIK